MLCSSELIYMFTCLTVRRRNKDRPALRPLTINLESGVDFDDNIPLSDVLSGLRTGSEISIYFIKKFYTAFNFVYD